METDARDSGRLALTPRRSCRIWFSASVACTMATMQRGWGGRGGGVERAWGGMWIGRTHLRQRGHHPCVLLLLQSAKAREQREAYARRHGSRALRRWVTDRLMGGGGFCRESGVRCCGWVLSWGAVEFGCGGQDSPTDSAGASSRGQRILSRASPKSIPSRAFSRGQIISSRASLQEHPLKRIFSRASSREHALESILRKSEHTLRPLGPRGPLGWPSVG